MGFVPCIIILLLRLLIVSSPDSLPLTHLWQQRHVSRWRRGAPQWRSRVVVWLCDERLEGKKKVLRYCLLGIYMDAYTSMLRPVDPSLGLSFTLCDMLKCRPCFHVSVSQAPTFDNAIMDFLDENCIIFDNEEENKFAYTDAHNAFRDLVRKASRVSPQKMLALPKYIHTPRTGREAIIREITRSWRDPGSICIIMR